MTLEEKVKVFLKELKRIEHIFIKNVDNPLGTQCSYRLGSLEAVIKIRKMWEDINGCQRGRNINLRKKGKNNKSKSRIDEIFFNKENINVKENRKTNKL